MVNRNEVVNSNGNADVSTTFKAFSELTSAGKDDNKTNLEDRVFIGNLSFQTTEIELKQHFMQIGTVAEVNIMTYGPRSRGYGFVTFEHAEDAHKAVEELNGSVLGSREINVEQAKPGPEITRSSDGLKGRGMRGKGRRNAHQRGRHDVAPINAETGNSQEQQVTGSTDREEAKETEDGKEGEVVERQGDRTSKGKSSKTKGDRNGRRRGRGSLKRSVGQKRGGPREGDLSSTTLFVANLPYQLRDGDLKSIFEAFNPKSAKVITYRNGVSKGFGFVELETAEAQRNALDQMQELVLDGREIVVKVAVEMPAGDERSGNELHHTGQSGTEKGGINASVVA